MKLSKFTNIAFTHSNKIVLYNSLCGTNSLSLVSSHYKEEIVGLVSGELSYTEVCKNLYYFLRENEYLLEDSVDEDALLQMKYLKYCADPILTVIIMPTENCNFRCTYCYENFELGSMQGDVQEALYQFISKKIHLVQGLHIMWFGGEPLLESNLIINISTRLHSMCRKLCKHYSAQITTNGFLLTPEMFGRLYQAGVYFYQVTIDGVQSLHDKHRVLQNGNGTYRQIVENIIKIKKDYPLEHFQLVIRTNLTNEILEHLNHYIEMCNYITANDQRVLIDIQFVQDWSSRLDQDLKDHLVNELGTKNILQLLTHYPPIKNLFWADFSVGGAVCPSAKLHTYLVRPNGELHKCSMHYNDNTHCAGDVTERASFSLVENSKWLCHFNACGKLFECSFGPICFGDHCPAQRIIAHDVEYECPRVKTYFSEFAELLERSGQIKKVLE